MNISETDGTLSVKTAIINYNDLEHKPSIGGITLIEGQTAEDLDLATSKATQSALNLKADKADTLAGYGITDAYTKEEVEARLSSVYKFKGSVPTIDHLPLENNVIGDVYNVEDTGANYAWDGDKWDKLSETIDLTPYALKSTTLAGYGITDAYTKEEVDVKIAEKDSLPAQADKQGTFLSTNGTSAFWSTLPESNDTTKGIVKLASVEELNEGLSESSVITVKNLSDKLLSKQNVLTAGEGISIVDDTISATINVPDNVVLSDNYVNAKLWKGTLSEYNSLPEYSDDITYIVTDDYNIAPSGTTNYEELLNKPQINSIELSGNKTLEELGIQAKGDYATIEDTNEIKENFNKLDNEKTNCLTKIPQDIKVELSEEGVLILKSGSKIYVPNGFEEDTTTQKFDIINIQEDISMSAIGDIENSAVYLNIESNSLVYRSFDSLSSGTTDPQTPSTCYYNTETNKILDTSSAGVQSQVSLPIAQVVASGGKFTEIKQIFNGFGYIGSTIFALPGVEGLIPNGRNEDGSLNNIKFITSNIIIGNLVGTYDGYLVLSSSIIAGWSSVNGKYDFEENINTFKNIKNNVAIIGILSSTNGSVTSLSPKNVFQPIDRNDTEWASIAGKPSNRYIDLNLEASGTSYIAPANGIVYFAKQAGANTPVYLWIENTDSSLSNISWINSDGSSDFTSVSLPVATGDVFKVYYTANGNTNYFRFIFDKGAK